MSSFQLIIDHTKVTGTHANFPVLLTGAVAAIPAGFWAGVTDPNGLDIRFYDTDNFTELAREIYSFDATNHLIEAWIQIPNLSDIADKIIYCRYGGSTIPNSTEVWTDINARVIMHFGVSDGPYVEKNSAGGAGGDINGSPTLSTGKIGNAYRFVNDSDNVNVGIVPSVHDGIFTVLAWAYATTVPSDYGIIACSNGREALFFGITPSNPYGIYPDIGWGNARYDSGWLGIATGDTFISQQGSWKRVVTTYDGTTMKIYVNGSLRISGTIPSMVSEPGVDIGNNHSGGGGDGYSFKGYIDEVDCYTDVKSDDWVATDFASQNDSAEFWGVSVIADFSAIPLSGNALLSVNYTDLSTGAISWDWDFGDGSPHSTTQNPSHTYAAGTYTVTLVINGGAATKVRSNYITVTIQPVANFVGSPTSGDANLVVKFTDLSTGATSWAWDFGDGQISTEQNPTHLYRSGTYSVSLTVNGSVTDTKIKYISVVSTAALIGEPHTMKTWRRSTNFS